MESVVDNSATKPVSVSKSLLSPAAPHGTPTVNTFHWEMNLYTVAFLGLLYYLTPDTHRVFFHVVFAIVAMDAGKYYYARGNLAGVPYTFPFVSLVALVIHPFRYWAELANIAMLGGLSLIPL